jgi:amidase
MTFDEFSRLDGMALAALMAAGELSTAEVTEAAIAAVESLNPTLNAVIATCFDNAMVAAREVTPGSSPLAGVPFLLKDVNLFDREMPTRFASRFFRDAKPKGDSEMVARWREAGIVFLGKSNTPEFAGEFVTEPVAYGPALNPWDPKRTTGGSSGGGGSAVASGMVPIAHGTDLGGSIRIPAACCGVFGFKPSAGLNPLGPHWSEIASGLDSDHVLTRSVRDSAASLEITADGRGGYLAALDRDTARLRIGVTYTSPEGIAAGQSQREALQEAAKLLEALGHRIEDYRYPGEASIGAWFDPLWAIDVHYLVSQQALALGRKPAAEELEPLTRWAYDFIERLSAAELFEARMAKHRAATALHRSMQELDVLLTPSLASEAPEVGALAFSRFSDIAAWSVAGYGFAPFSAPANIAGQPSASIPLGRTPEGLPLAIQITGKAGDDALVLGLSRQIEDAKPWARLAPCRNPIP